MLLSSLCGASSQQRPRRWGTRPSPFMKQQRLTFWYFASRSEPSSTFCSTGRSASPYPESQLLISLPATLETESAADAAGCHVLPHGRRQVANTGCHEDIYGRASQRYLHLRVWQVSAYVAFFVDTCGASVRDLMLLPDCWLASAAMSLATASAA